VNNKNDTEARPAPDEGDLPSVRYAWYVVFVLMFCYTFSFIDRQIMAFLVGSIKQDLQINDTQMGLLGGLAFAVLYTLLGLPMGRLADTRSRRAIIAIGVVFWSVMTALCSLARSFWSLFAARVGVGIGEATLAPAAFSLISDYFPKDKIARALSVYAMGILIGSGLASILGGAVVQAVTHMPPVDVPLFGTLSAWRLTFIIVGLPGILIALLLLTVKEPVRRNLMRNASGGIAKVSLSEAIAQIKIRWVSVLGLSLGVACQSMCNYAVGFWGPAYFARVHGWSPAPAGMALGLSTIFAGCAGLFVGGWLCDRWQKRGLREAPLRVGAIGVICAAIPLICAFSVADVWWTVALLVPSFFFLGFPIGSTFASVQWIFPNQVRGMASALLVFVLNLGGMSLGSFLPGFFNDAVFHDETKIGQSLVLTIAIASVMGASIFRATYAPYRRDHERMNG
jgi:MFS family permease